MSRIFLAARAGPPPAAAAQQDRRQDSDEKPADDGNGQQWTHLFGQVNLSSPQSRTEEEQQEPLGIPMSMRPPQSETPMPLPLLLQPPSPAAEPPPQQRPNSAASNGGPQEPSLSESRAAATGSSQQPVRSPVVLESTAVEADQGELLYQQLQLAQSDDIPAAAAGGGEDGPAGAPRLQRVNEREKIGRKSLIGAAKNGHLEVAKALLEAGADVNAADKFGKKALIVAVRNGHLEVAEALLEAGAEVNAADESGQTALMKAAANGHMEAVEALVKAGADVNATDGCGQTALIQAAANGHLEAVKALVKAGADVNAADGYGWRTALMEAAANGRFEAVEALIQARADVNAGDESGQTALIKAAANGHLEAVKALVKARADVNAADGCGQTALIHAAANGHLEAVNALLKAGADVNAADEYGRRTALMEAAANGHLVAVEALIKARADLNKADVDGRTALTIAVLAQRLEAVKALLKAGADVNAADECGQTALIHAAANGHLEAVKALLKAGADGNAVDKDNISSLLYATVSGHLHVMDALLKHHALILFFVDKELYLSPDQVNTATLVLPEDSTPAKQLTEALTTQKGDTLYELLHGSATNGGLNDYCAEVSKPSNGGSSTTAAMGCDGKVAVEQWLPRPEVLIFICRVMLAAGQDLLCSKLVGELLPRSIAKDWWYRRLDNMDDYGRTIFMQLVEELAQRNPRLLAQLILGARTPLFFRIHDPSQRKRAACLTLKVERGHDPLIAPRGSTTDRVFLPLAFSPKCEPYVDEPHVDEPGIDQLYNNPEMYVGMGRAMLFNVAEAVRTCLAVGLRWMSLLEHGKNVDGDDGGRGRSELLAAWATIIDNLVWKRRYACVSLAFVHFGPTGFLAAVIMAFGWLLPPALLQLLQLLQLLLLLVVLLPARAMLALIRRTFDPVCPKSSKSPAAASTGRGGDDSWYTVSVSEVQLPGAATLLTHKILGRLLSDPRVDPRLWTSPAFQAIMEMRWLWFTRDVVMGLFLIRVANLVVFIIYVLNLGGDAGPSSEQCQRPTGLQAGCMITLSVMTAEYAVAEARQVMQLGWKWWSSSCNVFDAAQIGLMATTLGLHWSCAVSMLVVRCLTAVLVLVLFWRLFGYATVVADLGNFVRMVNEVSLDLRWFFVFLGTIFCGFGVALTVLQMDMVEQPMGGTASRVFARLFSMIFGDFDAALLLETGEEGGAGRGSLAVLTAVICSLYMLFVAVILLNLLIAVIGDAYDRVCKDSEMHLARSRAAFVVETEQLLPAWFLKARDEALLRCNLLLIMQPEKLETEDEERGDDANRSLTHNSTWRGRLRETQALLATTENLPVKSMLRELKEASEAAAKEGREQAAGVLALSEQVKQQAAQLARLEALVTQLLPVVAPQASAAAGEQ